MSQKEPGWDLYRTFLSVMREGSLSAAARELGLTQPTIGRQIDTLETTIGVQLFIRTQQGLMPTEAAIDLRPHAEQLAAHAATLLRAASAHGGAAGRSVRGTVRVSASEVIGVEVLPPILEALGEAHSELVIELSLSDTIEDLMSQRADIAVRMAEPTQDALIVRRIGGIAIGLHAHRRYLERHGVPETGDDLGAHRMIGYDQQTSFVRTMRKRYPLLDGMRFALKADSNLAQLALIRAGCGIGFCQLQLGRRDPGLVHILEKQFSLTMDTCLVMHENLKTVPRCRVAFDALVEGMTAYLRG